MQGLKIKNSELVAILKCLQIVKKNRRKLSLITEFIY